MAFDPTNVTPVPAEPTTADTESTTQRKLPELIAEFVEVKEKEVEYRDKRVALELEIIEAAKRDKEIEDKQEGAQQFNVGNFKTKVTNRVNYVLDVDSMISAGYMAEQLPVTVKYDFNKTKYNKLEKDNPVLQTKINEFLTKTPAKPAVAVTTIEE